MIALSKQRALLGAVICCAPMMGAWAAREVTAAAVSASPEFQSSQASYPATCFTFDQLDTPALLASTAAPELLAAASLPAPGTRGKPPSNPLQNLQSARPMRITGPISWASDREDANANVVTLSGNVEAHMGDQELQADQLIYNRATNDISVSGSVHYSDPDLQLQGDSGQYGDAGALFNNAQFHFLKRPGRGAAQDLAMSPSHVLTGRNFFYTSCPSTHTDWDIRARELQLDTAANRGVAHGARVDFLGVPIIYLPYLSFPLSNARQSGLLFPTFGTNSRDGVYFGVPWYWNIAPNQDATFTPTYYSDRGIDLGAEYRFLSSIDSGTFDGDYMPHDSDYGSERSYVKLLDRLVLPDNTRVDADLESVSDTAYFEDFTQGVQSTSTAFLPRDLAITHRDDIWIVSLQTLAFQTIDNTLAIDERPYVEAPRLDATANWSPQGWPWLLAGFDGEAVNFSRSSCLPAIEPLPTSVPSGGCIAAADYNAAAFPDGAGVSGWRLDARPQLGLDLSEPGYFFRPSVAWEFTQYVLRDVTAPPDVLPLGESAPGVDSSPERNLPIVTVDSGLIFDRLAGPNGVNTVTLEPRMMYVYIPYRNQNGLPLFDTDLPDPNLIELFRPNRYVGLDRIGDANEVTLGLTSQLFSTANGTRYVSATIGQSIYFTPPQVSLPDETLSAHTSDLIGEVNVAAYHDWNLMLDVASNAEVTRIEEVESELQYRLNGTQVANFGYQFAAGQFQQIDASVAWPIFPHWDLYARSVYSLLGGTAIEELAGLQYRGDCWGVRAVWQSSLATRTGARDNGVMVQLELIGLSNVGSQIDSFLQQAIRGYSTTPNGRVLNTPSTP